jgi:PPOX class probable F420-dependent enzyme
LTTRIEGWAGDFLAREGNFATLSTIAADGSPRQAVIWFTLTDDGILINSAVGRAWPTNLLRDSRCSIAVEDGYEWVGIRGSAESIADQPTAQADIAEMSRRYYSDDPERGERLIRDRFAHQERISFLIRPASVVEHPDV